MSVVSIVLMGPANAPLILLVSTVARTVPSNRRYVFPEYWSHGYLGFLEAAFSETSTLCGLSGGCSRSGGPPPLLETSWGTASDRVVVADRTKSMATLLEF